MMEKNVRGGFRGAGLVPLDPKSVICGLDVKLRTPTPAEGVNELKDRTYKIRAR